MALVLKSRAPSEEPHEINKFGYFIVLGLALEFA